MAYKFNRAGIASSRCLVQSFRGGKLIDSPKSLASQEVRAQKLAALSCPYMQPLRAFVELLRQSRGPDHQIPDFDPDDGGIDADCLYLLEAPGPKAVSSGFISRNNPDETAKNFFLLNAEAGIDRRRTVVWNIVPWYVGSGKKIRPANSRDIGDAAPALRQLLALLPRLHSIILVGGKAASARDAISALAPHAKIHVVPHPSPMFVNRSPANRDVLLSGLRQVAAQLPTWITPPTASTPHSPETHTVARWSSARSG